MASGSGSSAAFGGAKTGTGSPTELGGSDATAEGASSGAKTRRGNASKDTNYLASKSGTWQMTPLFVESLLIDSIRVLQFSVWNFAPLLICLL